MTIIYFIIYNLTRIGNVIIRKGLKQCKTSLEDIVRYITGYKLIYYST